MRKVALLVAVLSACVLGGCGPDDGGGAPAGVFGSGQAGSQGASGGPGSSGGPGAAGGPGSAGGSGSQAAEGHPGSTPEALVGSWYAGSGYTTAPYDPATGSWGTPSGKGLVYVFDPGGTYTKAFQSYNSAGGCTNGFSAFESGTLSVSGDQLVTSPSSGHTKYSDSCAPSLDSDEPLTDIGPETFAAHFEGDELVLARSDGATGRFRRIAP